MYSHWKAIFSVLLMLCAACYCAPPPFPRPEGKLIELHKDDMWVNHQFVYLTADESGSSRFTSPAHVEDYKNNVKIYYRISAPYGSQIRFDAEIYDVAEGSETLIFSEFGSHNEHLTIGSFDKAVDGIRSLQSTTNYVIATLSTESLVGRGGFSIVATAVKK